MPVHGDPNERGEKERKDEKLLQFHLICAPAQRKQKILCQTLLGVPSDQQLQQTTSVLNTEHNVPSRNSKL